MYDLKRLNVPIERKEVRTLCHKEKVKRIDSLRHNEYYGMQNTFDELYSESIKGSKFHNLMDIVLEENNILLA